MRLAILDSGYSVSMCWISKVLSLRGGESYRFSGSNRLAQVGWFVGNSEGRCETCDDQTLPIKQVHPVGQKKPNNWGLYDMSGNVPEWTFDGYGDYPGPSVTDPQGSPSEHRVIRGGGWYFDGESARVAHRQGFVPTVAGDITGFRIVRNAD